MDDKSLKCEFIMFDSCFRYEIRRFLNKHQS